MVERVGRRLVEVRLPLAQEGQPALPAVAVRCVAQGQRLVQVGLQHADVGEVGQVVRVGEEGVGLRLEDRDEPDEEVLREHRLRQLPQLPPRKKASFEKPFFISASDSGITPAPSSAATLKTASVCARLRAVHPLPLPMTHSLPWLQPEQEFPPIDQTWGERDPIPGLLAADVSKFAWLPSPT